MDDSMSRSDTEVEPAIRRAGDGYRLKMEQTFDVAPDELFSFVANPTNLERLMPPSLNVKLIHADHNPVREGTFMELQFKLGRFPFRWTGRVTDYRRNEYFKDEMDYGPFRVWEHSHMINRTPDGHAQLQDLVYYELPAGLLGRMVHGIFVGRRLRSAFLHRADVMRSEFPGPR